MHDRSFQSPFIVQTSNGVVWFSLAVTVFDSLFIYFLFFFHFKQLMLRQSFKWNPNLYAQNLFQTLHTTYYFVDNGDILYKGSNYLLRCQCNWKNMPAPTLLLSIDRYSQVHLYIAYLFLTNRNIIIFCKMILLHFIVFFC